jgi:uncharacterized protein (DUF1697 family)
VAETKPPWRIALLRAVNLPSHKKVAMADLRALMAEAGLAEGQTLLQSGNLVFRDERTPQVLESTLETVLDERLGLRTEVMVRSAQAWMEIIRANPFAAMAENDPSHLVVVVTKGSPRAGALEALQAAIKGREEARQGPDAVYISYPDGIGTSKLTNAMIDRALGVKNTARNWNTVQKLANITAPSSH